jgi:hypothetical protein
MNGGFMYASLRRVFPRMPSYANFRQAGHSVDSTRNHFAFEAGVV